MIKIYLTIDFLHKSFFNQFNCLSFTQSKLYMPASKLNRRFNLLRGFLFALETAMRRGEILGIEKKDIYDEY